MAKRTKSLWQIILLDVRKIHQGTYAKVKKARLKLSPVPICIQTLPFARMRLFYQFNVVTVLLEKSDFDELYFFSGCLFPAGKSTRTEGLLPICQLIQTNQFGSQSENIRKRKELTIGSRQSSLLCFAAWQTEKYRLFESVDSVKISLWIFVNCLKKFRSTSDDSLLSSIKVVQWSSCL